MQVLYWTLTKGDIETGYLELNLHHLKEKAVLTDLKEGHAAIPETNDSKVTELQDIE